MAIISAKLPNQMTAMPTAARTHDDVARNVLLLGSGTPAKELMNKPIPANITTIDQRATRCGDIDQSLLIQMNENRIRQ
jgi:hypothetical protein